MKTHLVKFFALAAMLSINLASIANTKLPSPKQQAITPINTIVAVVNKGIITQQEFDKALYATKQQFMQRGATLPNAKTLRHNVLQGLIFQKLQLQLAKQNRMTITDSQLNTAITRIAQQNHVTVAQMKSKLAAEGTSFKTFKSNIRDQLLVNQLQQQVVSGKLNITNAQVAKFKKEITKQRAITDYHLIDYLIPLPDAATAAQKQTALKQAKALIFTLKRNRKPSKGVQSNDLGWQPLSDLPDAFATRVVKMRNGSVSQPILTSNGYHVIKLAATKEQSAAITDQQARQMLFQKKYAETLKAWLDKVRENAYIKIYPN